MDRASFNSRFELLVKRFSARRQDGVFREVLGVFCGGLDPYDFVLRAGSGEVDLVACFARLVDAYRGKAPKTIKFYLFMVMKFLRVMGVSFDRGLIRELIDIPKGDGIKQDRAPTKDELRKILMHSSPRNRVLFMLMAVCGLRLSEALNLRVSDVIFDHQIGPQLRVRSAKSGKVRLVPLTREMAQILRDYISGRDASEYLFHPNGKPDKKLLETDVQQYFYSTLKKCGLLKRDGSGKGYEIHLHSLRKFFKTQLEGAGVNPLLIERWMGHNIGSVAQAYFRPSEEMLLQEWAKAEEALTIYGQASGEEVAELARKLVERLREIDDRLSEHEKALKRIKKLL
ncbi:MAG: tyrosine-type recombinase/integrase [Nitrososphaerota archaeon]